MISIEIIIVNSFALADVTSAANKAVYSSKM